MLVFIDTHADNVANQIVVTVSARQSVIATGVRRLQNQIHGIGVPDQDIVTFVSSDTVITGLEIRFVQYDVRLSEEIIISIAALDQIIGERADEGIVAIGS